MDIKENLDAVGFAPIEEFVDVILSAVSAANVRAILVKSPVTNGQTDDFNLAISQVLD